MKKFWMLALVAAFGMSACDTAPETADADAAMEESFEETADDMAMTLPALGDYTLVAIEGGNPETVYAESDVRTLNLEESTWTFAVNGETMSEGGWVAEEGRVRVMWETGDCAGHEGVYDLDVGDAGFTMDLVESGCELAPTHSEYAMAGDVMEDHDAMEEGAEMEDGGDI